MQPGPTMAAFVGATLSAAARPVGRRRFRRQLRRAPGPVRVNLGAGPSRVPGFLDTDISWRAPLYLDLTRGWPGLPETVTHFYADNLIEHLPLPAARDLFTNCLRALVPGGAVRFVTPDLERIARAYLDDPVLARRCLARQRRHGYAVAHPVDLLRSTFAYHGHHLGYWWDFDSLGAELTDAGFERIERARVGESTDPVFAGLEQRAEATDVEVQLAVEARKPAR